MIDFASAIGPRSYSEVAAKLDGNCTFSVHSDWGYPIAANSITKKIFIGCGAWGIINYSDVLGFNVIDDATTTKTASTLQSKTNTGSLIGRSVVGGILGGGIGAVIGGATASRSITGSPSQTLVKHNYKVVIRAKGAKNDYDITMALKEDASAAESIAKFLQEVINSNNQPQDNNSNFSVADELLKLNQLKDAGIITFSEFESQKKKLLGLG